MFPVFGQLSKSNAGSSTYLDIIAVKFLLLALSERSG